MYEHRKYKRAKLDCQILYPIVIYNDDKKTYGENVSLYTCDISESGISLHSNFFIPIDSFVYFYLRILENLPFRALVRILWNKTLGDTEFICGGEFVALRMDEINILRKYVESYKS